MMTDETQRSTVLVVGLGAMGGAMASWLVTAGWNVEGFDPSAAARDRAAAHGVRPVEQLDESTAPFVVLSLPSAAIVQTTVPTLLARSGLRVIVDTTTSDPETSRQMSELAATHAVSFVDAPVSGGRAGAESGTLSAFVGGNPDSVAAAEPLLHDLTAGKFQHIGNPGAGNIVKLLNNVLCATQLAAVGEALDIAAAYDVDLGAVSEAISGASGGSKVIASMIPNWVLSGTYDSGFTVGLMARDVHLALEIGAAAGASPSVLASTDAAWQSALGTLGASEDFVAITGAVSTATDALNPAILRAAKEHRA